MKKVLRKILLKFRPIEVGDHFFGYTKDLVKDESVRHLNRIISLEILSSEKDEMKVRYRYSGKGGNDVQGFKIIKRKHMNNHYISNRISFV